MLWGPEDPLKEGLDTPFSEEEEGRPGKQETGENGAVGHSEVGACLKSCFFHIPVLPQGSQAFPQVLSEQCQPALPPPTHPNSEQSMGGPRPGPGWPPRSVQLGHRPSTQGTRGCAREPQGCAAAGEPWAELGLILVPFIS